MVKSYVMMNPTTDIHDIQALIMRQLFTHETLRFSAINSKDVPSDQFSYHLRQLTKYGLIEKDSDNYYKLSVKGRGQAILMDAPANKFIEQGFVACRIILARESDGQKQYLMQKRQKVPYHNYISEPGGKILFGEDIAASAKRNLYAETGLTCDLAIQGVAHFKDNYQGQVVQDKFFFIIRATDPRGELIEEGSSGLNVWMTLPDIESNPKTHKSVLQMIQTAEGQGKWLLEDTHFMQEY